MSPRSIHRPDEFAKELKHLAKKQRDLPKKVDEVLEAIAASATPIGDRIPGVDGLPVFKTRVRFGNVGLSGAARLIYHFGESTVSPVAIYLKSEKSNIQPKEVMEALKAAGLICEGE